MIFTIDYCIVNGTYFAGTKEDKKYNHWIYLMNTVEHSLGNKENFQEFFKKLEHTIEKKVTKDTNNFYLY